VLSLLRRGAKFKTSGVLETTDQGLYEDMKQNVGLICFGSFNEKGNLKTPSILKLELPPQAPV
jgi:hypothetical protein